MSDRGKLGNFLSEVINWDWREFCEAEKDPKYSGLQATVLALVRTTSEGKLGAIRLAIDRVDGKLETPVKLEFPKVYNLYPEAETVAELPSSTETVEALPTGEIEVAPPIEETSKAVIGLRATLEKLADSPRQVTQLILAMKKQVEADLRDHKDIKDGEEAQFKIPAVKSVIAANLMNLAEKNNFEAITEVFDQIDGKLVETIKVLGDDIYLTQYALIAPAGAKKNKDGIYQIEMEQMTANWREKLDAKNRR